MRSHATSGKIGQKKILKRSGPSGRRSTESKAYRRMRSHATSGSSCNLSWRQRRKTPIDWGRAKVPRGDPSPSGRGRALPEEEPLPEEEQDDQEVPAVVLCMYEVDLITKPDLSVKFRDVNSTAYQFSKFFVSPLYAQFVRPAQVSWSESLF